MGQDDDQSDARNPVYTGHLYWNRLDSRAHKQGVGPVTRRSREEWIEADEQHEPVVTEEQFERAQAEMQRRSTGHGNRRRRPQKRFYLLRGIVHCATGHNPLRMQGRGRKGEPTYTPAAIAPPMATARPRRSATANGNTCARTS